MHSQQGDWVHGGLNPVIFFSSCPPPRANPPVGYNKTIQDRIIQLLSNDIDFRAKCQTLLDGKTIDIDVELNLAYTSFVVCSTFLRSWLMLLRIMEMPKAELWSFMYYAGYLTQTVNLTPLQRSIHLDGSSVPRPEEALFTKIRPDTKFRNFTRVS